MTNHSRGTADKPRTGRIIAISVLAVVLLAIGWLGYRYWRISQAMRVDEPSVRKEMTEALDPVNKPQSDASEPLYILILGADARPGQTRSRSDTIILARVDLDNKKIMMLSIPRDSRVEIPGRGLDKINHAHAYGGPALTIKTVKEYTGLPVHHYVELDFQGFTKLVDVIGGVTLTLDEPVAGIPAGTQTLDSEQALAFVRSRAFPDGDFRRVKHQQRFIAALLEQALAESSITRLPSILEAMADNVKTDMSVPQVLELARTFKGISQDDIEGYTVPGNTAMIDGVSYVIPSEDQAAVLFEQFREGKVAQ